MHAPLRNSSFLKSASADSVRRLRKAQELSAAHQSGDAADEAEEKCPVIRAHQVFITGGSAGRTRVVFF